MSQPENTLPWHYREIAKAELPGLIQNLEFAGHQNLARYLEHPSNIVRDLGDRLLFGDLHENDLALIDQALAEERRR